MAFQIMRCPYCASEGQLEQRDGFFHCVYCGNKCLPDGAESAFNRIQEGLSAQMQGALDEVLLKAREEEYYNLRSLLWEKVYSEYSDSAAIIDICRDIKKLNPHDFLACFFELANADTPAAVSNFINKIDVEENALFVDLVIDFTIKSLRSEYVMPLGFLIERAYKKSDLKKFEEYSTKLEEEAKKVDSGIYSTLIPRDVFIAYSSKDIDKVIELMTLLEENGLSCFVALRNLQHGRDAVANYREALRAAIDNSRFIVFVSSENSRSFNCDALKEELGYVRESEQKSAPPEYRNDYANLPAKYKKMRVEYRLDDKPTAVDRFVREFFSNLDYCETPEKVLARLVDYSLNGAEDLADATVNEEGEVVCASCGAKNKSSAKFCTTCGANFVKTQAPKTDEKKPNATEKKEPFIIDGTVLVQYVGKDKKVIIPDFITEIAPSAFIGCDFITKVEFTSNSLLTTIGANAFCNCTGLVNITVPKCVGMIGAYAFFGCKSLAEIVIPDGVMSIGEHAFEECPSLGFALIPKKVMSVGEDAFKGVKTVRCKAWKPLFGKPKGWHKNWLGKDKSATTVMWGCKG